MSKNGKIRIGIIGCGRAGMIHAKNFAFRIRESEITALIDPSGENIAAARAELGVPDAGTFGDYATAMREGDFDRGGDLVSDCFFIVISVWPRLKLANISSVKSRWR